MVNLLKNNNSCIEARTAREHCENFVVILLTFIPAFAFFLILIESFYLVQGHAE